MVDLGLGGDGVATGRTECRSCNRRPHTNPSHGMNLAVGVKHQFADVHATHKYILYI